MSDFAINRGESDIVSDLAIQSSPISPLHLLKNSSKFTQPQP